MIYTKLFKELRKTDAGIAGGKGASLGEMLNAGIPVPDGYVVLSSTFDTFLHKAQLVEEIDAILEGVDHKAVHSVDAASEKIQELIKHVTMPDDIAEEITSNFKSLGSEFVAVRSSATAEDGADHAWAGQLDSYLNTTEKELLLKVQHCWASLFTPRAIFYRFEKGLYATKISVAVVVQKMVNSEKSGIAFSVHPVTEDRNQLIIEAGFGLGEAIVSGSVTPDSYVVEKTPRKIIDKFVSEQTRALYRKAGGGNEWVDLEHTVGSSQVLNEKEIYEFSEIIVGIENHYGFPCDIEWAYEGGKFYITQSRPITTLSNLKKELPRWEKVLQRNFPPLAWTSGAYFEFRGFTIGSMNWVRGREIQVKYNTTQSYMIQDPSAFYVSNIDEVIKSIDPNFDVAIDEYNNQIYSAVRIHPTNSLSGLGDLNETHKLMYALMLIGFDVVIDIKSHLDKIIPIQNDAFLAYLETPWKPTAVQRERLAIHEAKIEISKNPEKKNSILENLKNEYGYLHQDYLGKPWEISDYEKAVHDEITLHSHMDDGYDLSLYSEYEQWLISIFKKFLYMYEEGRNAMVRAAWAMKEVMKSQGNNPETILYMTANEVTAYTNGEIGLISDNIVEQRKKYFALYFEDGKYFEYTGEAEVKKLINEQNIGAYWEISNDSEISLKGSIAFKGYAKGKARLVFTQEDANNIEDGEILIAPMTQVEFLSGIRKCGAIVTDEGGIICHAAIVSREFGKPCILATGKATKVFKNGDFVEVDANKGTISLIDSFESKKKDNSQKLNELVRDLKKVDWEVQRFNAYPFYISSVATFSGFKLPWGLSYTHFLCISHNKNTEWYYDKGDYVRIGEVFWNKVKTLNDLGELISEYHAVYKNAVEDAFYYEDDLAKLSVSKLKDLLQKQADRLFASVNNAHIIEAASYVAEKKLKEEYYIDPQSIQPTDLSFLKKAALFAHELCVSEKDKKVVTQKFKEKYAWIQSSYLGRNEITFDQIHKLAETPEESSIVPNKETNVFLNILARMFSWQDERKGNILESIYSSEPVLRELALKLDFPYESIRFLLPEEISKVDDKDFQNELTERTKLFVDYTPQSLVRTTFIGSAAHNFIDSFVGNHEHEGDEIKGSVAYPGKVIGVVRVCLTMDSIENFKVGEILVASMTRPEYIPSMKKAIAFITDEGGITCHAAIIAREMKKPCVIGTKVATKVLKDGDLVEVDANLGIVRILKKGQSNKNTVSFNGIDWGLTITRNMSFWHSYIACRSYYHKNKAFGVDAKIETLAVTEDGTHSHIFMHKKNLKDFTDAILVAVNTKKKINNLKKVYKKFAKELLKSLEVCNNKFSVKNLEKFIEKYEQFTPGLNITAFLGRRGLDELTEKLISKGYNNEEVSDLINSITYPSEHTPLFNSQLELLEIAKKIKQKNISQKEIDKRLIFWLDKHGYIPVNFCDEPWTIIDAQKQLDEFLLGNPVEDYDSLVVDHKKRVKKSKEDLKKINNKEISVLAYALSEATFLNEFRKNIFSRVSLGYRPIFKKIADLGGSSNWRDCFYITSEEMIALALNQKISISSLVDKRKLAGVCIDQTGKRSLLKEEQLFDFSQFLNNLQGAVKSSNLSDVKNIKGNIANKGKVTAIARIVLSSKDFDKLSRGEILVTTMTSVDFVPVMERAGAFVTNEGGITSHASIVAREMNKPCIIGTHNATQIIKDGDMVEVDANNGIVRIVN
jgi:phosphoenolpyruvate synthase/pyruvate phosphate dikinase